MKEITIKPTTRMPGRAKITIHLDDNGKVADSRFQITEFRGFEKFCEGRMFWEMPLITTRICGICPVSHHLASVKACDNLLNLEIPLVAKKLRELLLIAEYLSSHAVHFFHFASPDFVLGPDSDPDQRNIVGIYKANPEIPQKASQLRLLSRIMIEKLGGSSIQPVTAIPGGMSKPLSLEDRSFLLQQTKSMLDLTKFALETGKGFLDKYADFGDSIETKYLSLTKEGSLELYDGNLRLMGAQGETIEDFDSKEYLNYIGERVEDWSYAKFTYYLKEGYPGGIYRCGPLARLNIAQKIDTQEAGQEHQEFKKLGDGKLVHRTVYYHYARLIELLYAAERAKELLEDEEIVNPKVRVRATRGPGEGIGVVEAPRGTLIHHYVADEAGKLKRANMIVATTNNNQAINQTLQKVAEECITSDKLSEAALNKVEMAIRCYDPCLSCSTHMIGQMPLEIVLFNSQGHQLDLIRR